MPSITLQTAITFPQTGTTYEAFSKLSAAADQYGVRHNTHYAEQGIMPSVVLNSLWGNGFPRAYSA
jgi:hypothetical protein